MVPRMKEKFKTEIAPKIQEKFGLKNVMMLPKIDKIILNVGVGKELEGTKIKPHVREQVLADLAQITGQRAVMVKAKKSVANFKVREGYETAAMVTLRGDRMWEFFDRLISLAIPRVKDFRGLPEKAFDKAGNYSFGLTEQGVFPEINMADAKYTHGMNVNVIISGSTPEISRFLLTELGVPFRRPDLERARRAS